MSERTSSITISPGLDRGLPPCPGASPGCRERPRGEMPRKSITVAIVLAVNWPPHAPAPGQAHASSACTSSSVIFPAARAPTASNTSWIVTSWPSEAAGRDRAVVEDEARDVEPRERHHRGGDRLVAADEADEAVEQVAVGDELDRVGDHLARDQRGAHAGRAHRDAVGDRDRVELDRRAARGADALLHVHGELALVEVARHRLDPRRRDADQRLREVLVGEADGLEHRARAGARSTPSVSAALRRLAGSVGCVVDAHAACGSLVGDRRGRTRGVREARASSAAATAAASAFAAQTTTDGPEPESVTPAVPGTGFVAQLVEQRRVLDAVRLVQPVVERGREQVGVAGGDRRAEQRRLRARRGGVLVRDGLGQARARRLGVHARRRARRRSARAAGRSRAARVCVTPAAVAPDQADAAEHARARGCRRGPRAAGRARAPRRARRRGPATASPATRPGGDRRGGRAEPALERDAVDEAEAVVPRPASRARTRAAPDARRSAAARRRPRPRA